VIVGGIVVGSVVYNDCWWNCVQQFIMSDSKITVVFSSVY
jgi:hypothetical protein